jgi:hypothetical protein
MDKINNEIIEGFVKYCEDRVVEYDHKVNGVKICADRQTGVISQFLTNLTTHLNECDRDFLKSVIDLDHDQNESRQGDMDGLLTIKDTVNVCNQNIVSISYSSRNPTISSRETVVSRGQDYQVVKPDIIAMLNSAVRSFEAFDPNFINVTQPIFWVLNSFDFKCWVAESYFDDNGLLFQLLILSNEATFIVDIDLTAYITEKPMLNTVVH